MERNRAIILGLLSPLIVFLFVGTVRFAIANAQASNSDEAERWEAVADGVEVLVLRPNAEPGQGHVVILRLSPNQQAQFDKDSTAFLNKYNIFPEVLTAAVNVNVAPSQPNGISVAAFGEDEKDKKDKTGQDSITKRPKDQNEGSGGKKPSDRSDAGSKKPGDSSSGSGGKKPSGDASGGGKKPSDGGSGGGTKPSTTDHPGIPKKCITVCDDFDGNGKGRCRKICN